MKKINIDEFLTEQSRAVLRATLEPVDDKDKVRITPYLGGTCGCTAALIVPKSMIAGVTPTGESHLCCGKVLRVVDIEFTETGHALFDVFQQLRSRSARLDRSDDEKCAQCTEDYVNCTETCDGDCHLCKRDLFACRQRRQCRG